MKTEQKCKIRMGEKSETNSVIAAKKLYEMNAEKLHRIRVYEPR